MSQSSFLLYLFGEQYAFVVLATVIVGLVASRFRNRMQEWQINGPITKNSVMLFDENEQKTVRSSSLITDDDQKLSIKGDMVVTGKITCTEIATNQPIDFTNDVTVNGLLVCKNDLDCQGNLVLNQNELQFSDLVVDKKIVVQSSESDSGLDVYNDANIYGDLTVEGQIAVRDELRAQNGTFVLDAVNGSLIFASAIVNQTESVVINGLSSTIEAANIICQNLTVINPIGSLDMEEATVGTLTVTSNLVLSELEVTNVSVSSTLEVTGNAEDTGLLVAGNAVFGPESVVIFQTDPIFEQGLVFQNLVVTDSIKFTGTSPEFTMRNGKMTLEAEDPTDIVLEIDSGTVDMKSAIVNVLNVQTSTIVDLDVTSLRCQSLTMTGQIGSEGSLVCASLESQTIDSKNLVLTTTTDNDEVVLTANGSGYIAGSLRVEGNIYVTGKIQVGEPDTDAGMTSSTQQGDENSVQKLASLDVENLFWRGYESEQGFTSVNLESGTRLLVRGKKNMFFSVFGKMVTVMIDMRWTDLPDITSGEQDSVVITPLPFVSSDSMTFVGEVYGKFMQSPYERERVYLRTVKNTTRAVLTFGPDEQNVDAQSLNGAPGSLTASFAYLINDSSVGVTSLDTSFLDDDDDDNDDVQ